ncbi:hypothetical protein I350_01999 [Cryptococcus amylolentus CBS 6273]|uniref:Enoyl reductase (ER) domain-containing protein n=1 Tax=Cryptococcus amylolentus CBS 6273 TaxID=1296118 RepID=A0A1E3KBY4_9TREE|nr:hypothetical protein I350_01999 [Cryptococcus amylolentus CBS 6273]
MPTALPLESHNPPNPKAFKPKDNHGFILHGALNTSFEQQPVPELGPNDVLVEIKKTGICGSDVHFYNTGSMGACKLDGSMCLGHESSGIVGPIAGRPLRLGDKVALEPGVTCRMCVDCKSGQYQICEHMLFAAYPPSKGGTLQRYYALPADLVYPLPESVALEYGAMMEPLSVATHAVANVGGVRSGYNVLITGAGPVGLLAMAVAKGMGANTIVAVDINEERLQFAREYAATHTYIPVKPNAEEKPLAYSERAAAHLLRTCDIPNRGPGSIDLVVDATGAPSCVALGLQTVRPGGTYVQVGFGPPDVPVPMFRITTNEINIKGAWRYGSGDYPLAIDLVARGLVDLKPLLTHTFKFEEALEAFEITKNGKDKNGKGVIKCVIDGPE